MWHICGQTLRAGEKKQINLEPGVKDYVIPTTLVCGAKTGKTLLVTAGIHAGEYPGIVAVTHLAREVDASRVQGNIIFMHCVNTSGFWERTVEIIPEDGYNLNHDYPGKEKGTTGERIAWYFMEELFPKVDFILDFHSGANTEIMAPLVFYPNAEKVKECSCGAAKALDLPFLVESSADKGEYSYAAHNYDVPGLLVEIGHSHSCEDNWVDLCSRNIKLLLQHLNIAYFNEKKTIKKQTIFKQAVYLYAAEQGLWYPQIQRGQMIDQGEWLGYTEDFFGNRIRTYYAEEAGTVLYYTNALSAPENTFLLAYGLEKSSEVQQLMEHAQSSDKCLMEDCF